MNWIIKFNQLDKKSTDKTLDIIAKFHKYKNDYKQARQSGDHIIMQRKKTNKIVPIPAHELKYGLILQIQKQIETNMLGWEKI